jgi:hypothetical protein
VCCEIPILPSVDTRPTEDWCALIGLADTSGVCNGQISTQATNITKYSHTIPICIRYRDSQIIKAGGT